VGPTDARNRMLDASVCVGPTRRILLRRLDYLNFSRLERNLPGMKHAGLVEKILHE
jgi:hypothetical protein